MLYCKKDSIANIFSADCDATVFCNVHTGRFNGDSDQTFYFLNFAKINIDASDPVQHHCFYLLDYCRFFLDRHADCSRHLDK